MYQKSLRNTISIIGNKNIKLKTGVSLFIVLICLLATGCSQAEPQDKNKELIQNFLEYELNAPNEEAIRAINALDKWVEEQKEGGQYPLDGEYNVHLKDTYGPYFTDSGYDRFVMTGQGLLFHEPAYKYNYQTTVTKIEVEQNKVTPTNYNFTAYVDYVKKGNEKMNVEITGIAIMREEGIEKLTYRGDKEMLRTLTRGD
ncbi:hypothetical protein [Sporosarcina beigongshangi]|uniref:hypothetical protein n=1 Tax=Sporosarcina beigongshangi TaxID=2782538 RepID=UPI001939D4AA|nr:hypothetical protein [Sporosarcina beigongshangi]